MLVIVVINFFIFSLCRSSCNLHFYRLFNLPSIFLSSRCVGHRVTYPSVIYLIYHLVFSVIFSRVGRDMIEYGGCSAESRGC